MIEKATLRKERGPTPGSLKFLQQNDTASNQLKRAYFQETVFRAYPDLLQYLNKLSNKPAGAIPTKKIKMPSSTSKVFELCTKK